MVEANSNYGQASVRATKLLHSESRIQNGHLIAGWIWLLRRLFRQVIRSRSLSRSSYEYDHRFCGSGSRQYVQYMTLCLFFYRRVMWRLYR